MIPRQQHQIVVQGMTGKQGTFWSEQMLAYGSNIVAGVNPKRAGTTHLQRPIYASVTAAANEHQLDIAVMFIPPLMVKAAALDACSAGVKLLVCLTEHIPAQDVMEILAVCQASGTQLVGPNTAGLVTPGECFVGIMPAFNRNIFHPGSVGIISRSGSLGTLISLILKQQGFGQSCFYGIGGDPMIGTSTLEALTILDRDPKTAAVVICGEIGGNMEEEAAQYAKQMQKPVVAFIAGKLSPAGKKMGHAGAIIADGKGDYASKYQSLTAAGVKVAAVPGQIPQLLTAAGVVPDALA